MIKIHYAFQACDTASNQNQKRYCGDDRTLLSKKSLISFLSAVDYCVSMNSDAKHKVRIFADGCSNEYFEYILRCKKKYTNIDIEVIRLNHRSLMKTVRDCWEWMGNGDGDIVYQVQDDYLFTESSIYEMICALYQIMHDKEGHNCIVIPYNNPRFWLTIYRYSTIPLMIFPSIKRYWTRCYDIPCTFMTTRIQFNRHWDIYEKFLAMSSTNPRLEAETLNKILVEREVLGIQPVDSIAFHMQSEAEKDPFYKWEILWDSVDINKIFDEEN